MNFKKLYIHFPMIVLLCEWIIVFYLHYNNPYHFITMSHDTLQIVLVGLLFIVTGYYFVNSFYLNSSDELPGDVNELQLNEAILGKIILFLSLLSTFGLILILMEISKVTNHFTLYMENPFIVRELIIDMGKGDVVAISMLRYKLGTYLFAFMYPVAAIGGVVSLLRSKWRYVGILPLILVIIYSLVNLSRFGLITSLGLWFFSRIYFSMFIQKNIRNAASRRTRIYITFGVVFILAFFYFIIRARATSEINLEYYAIRSIYSYLTGSGAAFDKFVFNGYKPMYGASSFRSVVEWLANFGLMDKGMVMDTHNTFTNISNGLPMRLNTYTFAKSPYEDFGIVGVGVIGLLWGMVTRYAVERCFREFSLLNIFFVALMIMSLFMTFYEFFFQGIVMFLFWFVIVYVIETYVRSRGVISSV